ncbi:MAG: M48 family metallopeptidase [Cyanobacteriota bacterium]|jgi:predicted Zn-dependent protease
MRFGYRLRVLVVAFLLSLSFVLLTPRVSQAQSWLQLLFQGVQYLQLANLSDQQEVNLGQQVHQQFLQQRQFRPLGRKDIQNYLNDMGQRLAATSSRPEIPYHFLVVEDKAVNAFATMGGYVYINTGLMKLAENEAELAGVVAHEIAHIAARHSVNRMKDIALSQGLITAAGLQANTLVQMMVQMGVNLPMSREAELEADELGLENLTRAGYAPIGMVTFMTKLQSQGSSLPEFLSTHPLSQNRVRALKSQLNPQSAEQGDGLDEEAYQANIKSLYSRPK